MNLPAEKYERLLRFIKDKGRNGVVIAFSGGVDSSTLAAICHNILGDKAIAVTAVSPIYPSEEIEEAKDIAREIGIKHLLIKTNQLSNENFVENPENRCYYCKKELLHHLQAVAERLGFKAIFEGTNFSDLSGHRPGFSAVKEATNAFSPWVENEFTKKEIRCLAQKLCLPVYSKPAMACLATRIPFGERITEEKLKMIEKAEQTIKKISGAKQIRVRNHDGLARIEVGRNERNLLFNIELIDKIAVELKKLGFKYVTFDLEGYRPGSMLYTLKSVNPIT